MNRKLLFGCIADDFTGASDAASFIAKSGMRTMLFNGVPRNMEELDIDAAVIALKTRTIDRDQAVTDSLMAADWLIEHGAGHLYSKYCSTFDSTPEGNIGPVMDALLERCQEESSIICPALPVNGRIVKQGKLYVNGLLLEERPMKDHPLTPMRESHVGKLMEAQSKYPCIMLGEESMRGTKEEIETYIKRQAEGKEHYYLVPDYRKDEDACKIAEIFGEMKVLSGGSGILTELCTRYMEEVTQQKLPESGVPGRAIILAGSCSAATLGQIAEFKKAGHYSLKVDPYSLAEGKETAESIWRRAMEDSSGREILIYSSDSPDKVKKVQECGKEKMASIIESTLSEIAVKAEEAGVRRIIVAGGETSGAVTQALGYDAYLIGQSIAPGVPVMIPAKNEGVRLVLKSGNFGQPDFFLRALEQTANESWRK